MSFRKLYESNWFTARYKIKDGKIYSKSINENIISKEEFEKIFRDKITSSGQTTVSPSINPINNEDTILSGVGEPGGEITVNILGIEYKTLVASDGKWNVSIPKQQQGTKIIAIQKSKGKIESTEVSVMVLTAQIEKPTINTAYSTEEEVSGTGIPGSAIEVEFLSKKYTTNVNSDSKWKLELDDEILENDIIKAKQKKAGKVDSDYEATTVLAETSEIREKNATIIKIYVPSKEKFQINLPRYDYNRYITKENDLEIDWGDGNKQNKILSEGSNYYLSHQYEPGIYTLKFYGYINMSFNDPSRGTYLFENQWDQTSSMNYTWIKDPKIVYDILQFGRAPLQNFYGTKNILDVPKKKKMKLNFSEGKFETLPNNLLKTYVGTEAPKFINCKELKTLPDDLFKNAPQISEFWSVFFGCTKLQTIPESLFEKNVEANNFGKMFSGCVGLQTIPEGLFKNNSRANTYITFARCTGLTYIPLNILNSIRESNRKGTFFGCTNASNYNSIPAAWKNK